MTGSGYRTWVLGETISQGNVQSYLQDQSVMFFASAAARTTAISTPTEGMVSYLSDTGMLEVYDGSAWVTYASTWLDDTSFRASNGSLSVLTATLTTVPWGTEITDTKNGHAAGATTYAVPSSGWYAIAFRYTFASGTTGITARVVVNTTAYYSPGDTTVSLAGSVSVACVYAAATDVIYCDVQHGSGSTKSLTGATLEILRIR